MQFQKISIQKVSGNSKGMVGAKVFEEKVWSSIGISRGVGERRGVGANQKQTFHEDMDIFWNHTIHTSFPNLELKRNEYQRF